MKYNACFINDVLFELFHISLYSPGGVCGFLTCEKHGLKFSDVWESETEILRLPLVGDT
jgi:hypothetical protein